MMKLLYVIVFLVFVAAVVGLFRSFARKNDILLEKMPFC